MMLKEELLKRQNEGYHAPLPELIERIERDSQKLKPSYAVLDIEDAVFYLKQYFSILERAIENSHKKAINNFINGDKR